MTAFLVSLAVTLASLPLLRAWAPALGLVDHPGGRSSHRQARPSTGGLAILLGLAAGAVASGLAASPGPALRAWAAGLLLIALVGALDDRFQLPVWPRLLAHLAAAALVTGATGGLERLPLPSPLDLPLGSLGPVFSVVWVAALVNFFNFMDGIDGLAGAQGAIAGATLALALTGRAPLAACLGAAVAGACISFLFFNWHPSSVFLGDAGSTALGYCFASIPMLIAPERRSEATQLAALSLFVFLADATTCLLGRLYAGRRLHESHRDHLYQRWVDAGAGHAPVAFRLALAALATSAVGLFGWLESSPALHWTALLLGAGLFALEWRAVVAAETRADPQSR